MNVIIGGNAQYYIHYTKKVLCLAISSDGTGHDIMLTEFHTVCSSSSSTLSELHTYRLAFVLAVYIYIYNYIYNCCYVRSCQTFGYV